MVLMLVTTMMDVIALTVTHLNCGPATIAAVAEGLGSEKHV